jgi:hypothetical protein
MGKSKCGGEACGPGSDDRDVLVLACGSNVLDHAFAWRFPKGREPAGDYLGHGQT